MFSFPIYKIWSENKNKEGVPFEDNKNIRKKVAQ